MKWGLWSVVAASNSATPPDGWPEGMAPSTVNDAAREMMAQIRTGISNIQFVDLGVTPTETGNTTFTLAGNQMQWYPYGNRVQANVGGTLLYGTVISSSFTTNTGVTLRFDAGNAPLTISLSAVATGFPSAANGALPESVYRQQNGFINATMDIWQKGAGPYGVSGGAIALYTADQWELLGSLTAGASLNVSRFERSANVSFVPTLAQAGQFLTNSYGISVSAAMAVVNTGTFLAITQKIEGFSYRTMAQKPLTLSFWVNSRQTGTYCVALQNAGQDRACVLQYSISSVATWEKKTLTFPKPPAAGTWDYSFGVGLAVNFVLVAGATFQGGAGNWTAANILATNAQTNFMTSAGNVLMFTAAKIEEGLQANPLVPVDIAMEIGRCKRYYEPFPVPLGFMCAATSNNTGEFQLGFYPKRQAPALSTGPLQNYACGPGLVATNNISAMGITNSSNNYAYVGVAAVGAITSTLAIGQVFQLFVNSSATFVLKSQL